MRKLLSVLSATCVLLTLGVVQARATTYSYPVSFIYNGDSVRGTFALDTTGRTLAFDATVTTAAGQAYDIVAEGDITGQAPRLSLSGSITVSDHQTGNIIAQLTINQTASNEWAAIDDFIMKLLAAIPH